jgi:hypothetical protein
MPVSEINKKEGGGKEKKKNPSINSFVAAVIV